jgi:thiol-disulfide isomerase/thioredoxin
MNKKTIFILFFSLLCSFLVVFLWGLCFFNLDYANQYTGFAALLATFYIPYFIPKIDTHKSLQRFFLFIGIILILAIKVYAQGSYFWIFTPVLWAVILYCLAIFSPKIKPLITFIAVVIYISVYFFAIYPFSDFGKEYISLQTKEDVAPEVIINENVNLADFNFLVSPKDSTKFTFDKPIVIETWNETCTPCIASIKDLQDEFEQDTSFHYIYLYQYRGKNDKLSTKQIFDFQLIKDKTKIRIDMRNQLFEKMELGSYPFFLVFGTDGKLKGYQLGYKSDKKDEVIEKIRKLVESSK